MTTKREAAAHVFFVAKLIRAELEGDENAQSWYLLLEHIARTLDPKNPRYDVYLEDGISRRVKIRRLIDHPATPECERMAAILALQRLDKS